MRQRPIGALTPAYSILDPVRGFINNSLSPGAYEKANGRLHVSLTTLNKFNFPVNRVVSSYSSDEELREVRMLILTVMFVSGLGKIILSLDTHCPSILQRSFPMNGV